MALASAAHNGGYIMKLNIGENIRSCRRKMNLTQEQLADKLGVSFQSVSRWENDLTYPDMELIPALTGIFGVSADELLGVSEAKKEQAAEELLGELARLSDREDASPKRMIEIIREIRRDHLNAFTIFHLRYSVNINLTRRFPELLPEIRLTMEQALERGDLDACDRNTIIQLMTIIEDDEHIGKFLDRYASGEDQSKAALLNERYRRRGEWDKFEPIRQEMLLRYIDHIIGWDGQWYNMGRPRDVGVNMLLSELHIDFLHKLCGQTPNEKHPISGNGELDFWVHERVFIGLKAAARTVASGDPEKAFVILEDVVSLLEKAMEITEPVELRCSSPFLADIAFTAEEDWNNHSFNYFSEGRQERFIYIWNEVFCYCLCPSNILENMRDERNWAWFNPVREDDRFKKSLERVERLIVYRDKPKENE